MPYDPTNNPYIPGDPYSYDLRWMVNKIQEWTDPLDSAERAEASALAAETDRQQAEAWAVGTIDGDPVTSDDPQYENSSKYWADQSAGSAQEAKDYADNIADPVSGIVTDWLADHITNPSNPPIDTSLTVGGAAADAKVTGDKMAAIETDIGNFTEILNLFYFNNRTDRTIASVQFEFLDDGSVRLNGTSSNTITLDIMGNTVSPIYGTGVQGDVYRLRRELLSGTAGSNPTVRAYNKNDMTQSTALSVSNPTTLPYDSVFAVRIGNGVTFNNAVFQFMVEKGTTLPDDYYNYLPYGVDQYLRNSLKKKIRVLGIGNSYTRDSIRWLWKIYKELGYDEVIIGHGYWGGSTLQEQYESRLATDPNYTAYTYYKYKDSQDPVTTASQTLQSILTNEKWDVVIFQQQSDDAGQYSSYDSAAFDINDFLSYVISQINNTALKIGIVLPWSHAHGYSSAKFASYYNSDPAVQLAANKTVVPQVAAHMTQCNFIVNAGIAIEIGRSNPQLSTLGTEMLRSDKNHLYYGIPSFMIGLMYAKAISNVDITELSWYPTDTDEGQPGIVSTQFLAYLGKQAVKIASDYIEQL